MRPQRGSTLGKLKGKSKGKSKQAILSKKSEKVRKSDKSASTMGIFEKSEKVVKK